MLPCLFAKSPLASIPVFSGEGALLGGTWMGRKTADDLMNDILVRAGGIEFPHRYPRARE